MVDENLVTRGRSPAHDIAFRPTRAAVTAPENDQCETKTRGDRRQSGRVSERVGTIQDRRRLDSDAPKRAPTREQIAHECLAARNQLVGKHKPWSGLEASVAQELIQFRRTIGTNPKVVVEDNRLAVE